MIQLGPRGFEEKTHRDRNAGNRWTGLSDGGATAPEAQREHAYYILLNWEAGLLHTAEQGSRIITYKQGSMVYNI